MPRADERAGRSAPKKPVFDGRAGMVKFAVWENQGKKGPFASVTFARLYKDGNDKWQTTSSFDVWDLADLARAAFSAEAYIRQNYGSHDEPGDEGRRGTSVA